MKKSIVIIALLVAAVIVTGCPIDPPFPLCPPFDQGRWNTAVYSPYGSVNWDIPAYAVTGPYYALADGDDYGQMTVYDEVDDSVYWILHTRDTKGYAWSRGQMNYLAVMIHKGGPIVDPNSGGVAYRNPSLIFVYDVDAKILVVNFYIEGWYHKMIFSEGSDTELVFANHCTDSRVYVDFSE